MLKATKKIYEIIRNMNKEHSLQKKIRGTPTLTHPLSSARLQEEPVNHDPVLKYYYIKGLFIQPNIQHLQFIFYSRFWYMSCFFFFY